MKRSIYLIASGLLAVLLIAGCAAQPTATSAPAAGGATSPATAPAAAGTLRVATDATFPPFEMVDETTKQPVGFDIDLMNALAQKMAVQVEYINVPFDTVLEAMQSCSYDAGLSAITITDTRKQNMLFSDPYIAAGQIVVVRSDETAIKSKDDLAGKRVGAQLATTGEIEAKKIPNITYKPFDTIDLAILDMINGNLDAVIVDNPTALSYVARFKGQIMMVGKPFTDESYGIAVCKNNTDLQQKINTALKAVQSEGLIAQLEQKWLVSGGTPEPTAQ